MVRFKNRYIITNISTENQLETCDIPDEVIYGAVHMKIQNLHGDFGVAAIKNGFYIKKITPQSSIILIRARHGPHRFVSSSLPFVDKINNRKVVLHTLYMGSTIRKCYTFLLKYHKQRANTDLAKLKDKSDCNDLLKCL